MSLNLPKTICPIMSVKESLAPCAKEKCELFNVVSQMCALSRLHQIGEALEASAES